MRLSKIVLLVAVGASASIFSVSVAPTPAMAKDKGHCPPGLAKKGSCIPPGHRKFYRGDRIPSDIRYRVIRYDDFGLRRPRSGEVYIETGRRIYLIAEATQRVIEAINLIDAATQ